MCILDAQKKMVMIGHEYEGVNFHRVELLGSRENSDDKRSELIGGIEQKATLHGSTGHFNEGAPFGDEPESSGHALRDDFCS